MKPVVFLVGSIVLGVAILATSIGALRETGSKDQQSGSRFGLFVACAIGALLLLQGVLQLLRRWGGV